MEWYFTIEESLYETQIHLPIYVDIFVILDSFQINKTQILWELRLWLYLL